MGGGSARIDGRRLWAKVEYDGTDFFGFQIQARERTVQGEIERALQAVTGCKARVVGAGRTDRGVHAQGQVVAFEVKWKHDVPTLQRALNAVLAPDVAIQEMGTTVPDFHPRFSAVKRIYRYTVLNQAWRSSLARRTAWHVSQPLDADSMAIASKCLVGTRDFATFGQPPQGENSVRTVVRAEWVAQWPFLTFDIEANAFLYRMVRSVVGTLVQVGLGQIAAGDIEASLRTKDRGLVKRVAPAHGLCLMQVDYPEGVLL